MKKQLSTTQLFRLRELLYRGAHPDRVEAYLLECRLDPDETLRDLNIRRKDILYWHRAKRWARLFGILFVVLSGAPSFLAVLLGTEHVSAGLELCMFVYGIALIYTGNFSIFGNSKKFQA